MTRLRAPLLGAVLAGSILTGGCASSHSVDPTNPQVGPSSPAIGKSYPYDLSTHCGVGYAYFEGHWWAADKPTTDDAAKGSNPYTGYVSGTMTLVSPTSAKFDGPVTATFHPFSGSQPPPCA